MLSHNLPKAIATLSSERRRASYQLSAIGDLLSATRHRPPCERKLAFLPRHQQWHSVENGRVRAAEQADQQDVDELLDRRSAEQQDRHHHKDRVELRCQRAVDGL